MILDNENSNLNVHEWITKYTENGNFDVVTGYFTIGALAYLSRNINEKIHRFRMVLGDIVNKDAVENKPLDLLNENITIEAAFKLNGVAQEAVNFLRQEKVIAKTLEPNFCHAKCYLFNPSEDDDRDKYFISGSSNLTEAGIGLKLTSNAELNIAETGNNNQYKELADWFENLWNKPQAHLEKTLVDVNGKQTKINFKDYLIGEIERIFIKYTPKDIYYKILFELFGDQIVDDLSNPEFNRKIGRLENSVIYNSLYEFQKKGVLSLIKMLQRYNGAILADAVGLGKTWSALAVIKYFQLEGREVIVLCPKKLEYNWRQYQKNQDSRFEKDKFDYFIRFHTDMCEDRLEKYTDRADKFFTNDQPKLIVIDESHNLRNDKSNRYRFLMEQILQKNEDIKVLLLSATPINNSLIDIRNQFKLLIKGNVAGFDEMLGVRNIDYSFRTAQKVFNEWRKENDPTIGEFVKKLPSGFFTLTDSLTVARTRKMITSYENALAFPKKGKPVNHFVTPSKIGNFDTFEELFEHFPPYLSGYQPAYYAESKQMRKERQKAFEEGESILPVLEDEVLRQRFLVKMMYILMVKRLESSWLSFSKTVEGIRYHHQHALDKIKAYEENKTNAVISADVDDLVTEEEYEEEEKEQIEFSLGKKNPVSLQDIDLAGNLNAYKKDLKKDLEALDLLQSNLSKFAATIEKETTLPDNHHSVDIKLETLIDDIVQKRASNNNHNNQKVIIFTVYRDTADYLFTQLKSRGFKRIAMVSGSGSRISDSDVEYKNFEPILERFAPYTKLYKEKEWDLDTKESSYEQWIEWISEKHPKVYEKIKNPIDILIATDALSEGQNLQDADMVINYDIHWNPVRIVQRMGRIDRLGSPNETIYGVNFWPSDNINNYLDLQGRIEQRMAAMTLAGSEVDIEFSDSFRHIAEDEKLESRMNARMLEQMQTTWEDIEVNDHTLGFDDLSLEQFRQDLLEEFSKNMEKFRRMPQAVYSGFRSINAICDEDGIIALLGYPAKSKNHSNPNYKLFELIYIDYNGRLVLLNQREVLNALTLHKNCDRYVPADIDRGNEETIQRLVNAMKGYMERQTHEAEMLDDGTSKKTIGKEVKDLLAKLKRGDKSAVERMKENVSVDEKYQIDNFDLITWLLVTK